MDPKASKVMMEAMGQMEIQDRWVDLENKDFQVSLVLMALMEHLA